MINFQLIYDSIPYLLRGALVSLKISAIGCSIGITLGTILGLLQSRGNAITRACVLVYVTIIRGTPMLIQIAFAVYVLPEIGIKIPAFWAAACAIGLNSGAYVSQIVRSGIASVSTGQIEAAQVLGFSNIQITRYIILPQALRVVLPALGNEFITLIKDSSLASTVGVAELTREGALIKSRTFDALSVYCAVALVYLVITTTISLLLAYFEHKANRNA